MKATAKSNLKKAHLEGGFRLFDGIRLTLPYEKIKK
jgi:hypothetical protein